MDNSIETVKDRLLKFLETENISKAEFARRMGLSMAYVGAMRKSLPEDKVMRMTSLFPRLNRDWLLYGEGDMYLHSGRDGEKGCDDGGFLVPLLPVEAFAGSLQNYSRGVALSECDLIGVPVRGAEFAIQISGNSMEPKIHDGTYAAICRINDRAFIPWGNPMVIDTENGVLVKVVYPSGKGDAYIEARSYNPDYPNFQIPKECIYGLYRIVSLMRNITTI